MYNYVILYMDSQNGSRFYPQQQQTTILMTSINDERWENVFFEQFAKDKVFYLLSHNFITRETFAAVAVLS